MSEEKTVHCVTCCQALPEGMKHPEFFGQAVLEPDATEVYDRHDELAFILQHIQTASDALLEIHGQTADPLLSGLYELLHQLTGEAKRRALGLRNAGLYWQGVDRNDDSLFPDLPPPPAVQQQGKED